MRFRALHINCISGKTKRCLCWFIIILTQLSYKLTKIFYRAINVIVLLVHFAHTAFLLCQTNFCLKIPLFEIIILMMVLNIWSQNGTHTASLLSGASARQGQTCRGQFLGSFWPYLDNKQWKMYRFILIQSKFAVGSILTFKS